MRLENLDLKENKALIGRNGLITLKKITRDCCRELKSIQKYKNGVMEAV